MVSKIEASAAKDEIVVRPMSVLTGAEILGVDLKQAIPPETVKLIRDALLKWKVVFFRDQNLDHAQHVAFARLMGEPTIGHVLYGHEEGFPEIYSVAKRRERHTHADVAAIRPWSGWHTDITTAINPPAISILRGTVIPPFGGDTQFTNLVAAYEHLSAPMREFLDKQRGTHGYGEVTAGALERTSRTSLARAF